MVVNLINRLFKIMETQGIAKLDVPNIWLSVEKVIFYPQL